MADPGRLLIVRQRPAPHPELESLLDELQATFQLDAYSTRQHLLGPGLAQLGSGAGGRLAAIAGVLRRHGYACWVSTPPRISFAPPRLRSLTIGAEAVEFHCEAGQLVRLARDTAAVGVLADLSGALAASQAGRLLTRNAYLGRGQATLFTPAEARQAILKGQPVFDCYLLDPQGGVAAAFRVLPGRFNPAGLGGRASLAATRNLEAVLELVGTYARPFRLYTDFGLSQLPGCRPQPTKDDPAALSGNLEALTRYGWLVAGLAEPPAASAGEESAAVPPAGWLDVAALVGSEATPGAQMREAVAAGDAAPPRLPPRSRLPCRRPLIAPSRGCRCGGYCRWSRPLSAALCWPVSAAPTCCARWSARSCAAGCCRRCSRLACAGGRSPVCV
jgi:hypothetical protein